MSKIIDLVGSRFGSLTVISRADNSKHGGALWLCKCDCGVSCVVDSANLRKGRQKSCGCSKHKESWNHTHGESVGSRLYRIWTGMKTRCYDENSKPYPGYGGRGISVCNEWKSSYEAFRDWALSNGYADNLSIDRVNNDLGYSPENCRWATQISQNNNRRSNRFVVVDGRKMTTAQAARVLGIDYHAYMKKLYREVVTC